MHLSLSTMPLYYLCEQPDVATGREHGSGFVLPGQAVQRKAMPGKTSRRVASARRDEKGVPDFEKYYRWSGAEGHQPSQPSGHAVHQLDTEPLQYRLPAHCLASTSFLPCSAMPMPAGSWWGTGATDLNGANGQHRSRQGWRYKGGWSKGWGGDRGWGRGVQDALVQAQAPLHSETRTLTCRQLWVAGTHRKPSRRHCLLRRVTCCTAQCTFHSDRP